MSKKIQSGIKRLAGHTLDGAGLASLLAEIAAQMIDTELETPR